MTRKTDREDRIQGEDRTAEGSLAATVAERPTRNALHCGDCLNVMREMPDECVDLIITSPPYANQRAASYGGVRPDEYVEWFLPIAAELRRVLKKTGTFILNI